MTASGTRLFEPELVLQALKKAGYKDTPHGLAELIDNSIQANAKHVHVFMFSENIQLHERASEQVVKIVVLDNGSGMDAATLEGAIGFGSGTRLNAVEGLGKFGMGLSAASIAFADEMKIFSWQNGIESALMTELSSKKVKQGEMNVPVPTPTQLDTDISRVVAQYIERKGTAVVWEQLNINPKRFSALSGNLEFLIGRIYRKFLHAGTVAIEVHDIKEGIKRQSFQVKPNDPLFLMAPSKTPSPYENAPLFKEFTDMVQPVRTVSFISDSGPLKGQRIEGQIRVKISYVQPGLRAEYKAEHKRDAGTSAFGKFADKNVGYSICREGRELMLDRNFAKPSDPTERWWGVEIDFDASLDEVFGVTTNKQEALSVPKFHGWNWKDEAFEGETQAEFFDRCREEEDPRAHLMELFRDIDNARSTVRRLLDHDVVGGRGGGGTNALPGVPAPEQIATTIAKEREEEGKKGEAFNDELPAPEDIERVADQEQVAEEGKRHIGEVLDAGGRFAIEIGDNPDSPAFFLIRRQRGMLLVVINSSHPFYKNIYSKLFSEPVEGESELAKEQRLASAQDAFKLALIAWARMEDESPSNGEHFRETRADWGRILKQFLRDFSAEN